MSRPLVVAHRGASHAAPDNTMAAFELALAEGADGHETDVRATLDGVLVLHHDESLPDGRPLAGCTFEDVRRAVAGLVRLDELCASIAGRCFLDVELKTAGQEMRVLATLDAHLPRWEAHSVVTSFLDGVVVDVRRRRPGARVGLLVDGPTSDPLGRARATGADFLAPHDALVDDALVAGARRADLPLVVWTVDDEDRARALAGVGIVEAIITNRPAAILGAVHPT